MKTRFNNLIGTVIIFLCAIGTLHAQEAGKKTKNPFPLSEVRKQEVLKKCESTILYYNAKFASIALDQWSKSARDSFLIAKARKINVMFTPEYYRDYNTSPSIETEITEKNTPIYPGKLWYKVTFYTDTLKEKMITRKLFYAQIWNNGQAAGFTVPIANSGIFFSPPLWEDGKYQDWKKRNYSPYYYINGYENRKRFNLDDLIRRKQNENREKSKN